MATQDKIKVVHSNAKWLHTVTRLVVVAIAAGAGVLSFDGLTSLATASGIRPELAWVWALVVDGFILVATFATYVLKDRVAEDRLKKYYAWFVLALFVCISIFGNAWHSVIVQDNIVLPDWVKICVSAIPPVAFFLAGHLLIIMMTPTAEEKKAHKREEARLERKQRMEDKKLISEEKVLDASLKQNEDASMGIPVKMTRVSTAKNRVDTSTVPVSERNPASIETVDNTPAPSEPETAETLPPVVEIVAVSTTEAPVEPVLSKAQVESPKPDLTVSNATPVTVMSKLAAFERLKKMHESGEVLPSGKEVGDWVGRKERSGQNILREFKASLSTE